MVVTDLSAAQGDDHGDGPGNVACRAGQRLAVAWFGPKRFASVAYAVIVAFSGIAQADAVLAVVAVAVLVSVVAHSSTDVAVARLLHPSGTEGSDSRSSTEAEAPASRG